MSSASPRQTTRAQAAADKQRGDILHAGRIVFFEHGYLQASLDEIADKADASKRSIYDHFGSKKALFAEVIASTCALFVLGLPAPETLPPDPAEGLRAFAAQVREVLNRPGIIRFQRLVISEAERHPELGQVFFDAAVLGARGRLSAYLHGCVAQGRLRAHEVESSARTLLDVMSNRLRLRTLLGMSDAEEDAYDLKWIEAEIATLLARFGAGSAEPR